MRTERRAARVTLLLLPGFALGLAIACGSRAPATPADVVVINGAVYPGNGGAPAEALAIAGDTILRVGGKDEILGLKTAATKVVDAHGGGYR